MLTVIGCGNPNRSDDGVGVAVAQRLRRRLGEAGKPEVQVFDAGTAGLEVMFQARGSKRLIIVDASATGAEPGTIYEVPGDELAAPPPHSLNLHDFRWDHALHAGRQIYKEAFPEQVSVFLIEAQNLDLGLELSPPVEAAGERVTDMIAEIIAAYPDRSAT